MRVRWCRAEYVVPRRLVRGRGTARRAALPGGSEDPRRHVLTFGGDQVSEGLSARRRLVRHSSGHAAFPTRLRRRGSGTVGRGLVEDLRRLVRDPRSSVESEIAVLVLVFEFRIAAGREPE